MAWSRRSRLQKRFGSVARANPSVDGGCSRTVIALAPLILRLVAAMLQNLLALDIGAGAVRRRVGGHPYARAADAREDPGADIRREEHNGNHDRDGRERGGP